jgi:hypothetical protein
MLPLNVWAIVLNNLSIQENCNIMREIMVTQGADSALQEVIILPVVGSANNSISKVRCRYLHEKFLLKSLSALCAGRPLPPGRFLVLISVTG